jgi:hypothetical protein
MHIKVDIEPILDDKRHVHHSNCGRAHLKSLSEGLNGGQTGTMVNMRQQIWRKALNLLFPIGN